MVGLNGDTDACGTLIARMGSSVGTTQDNLILTMRAYGISSHESNAMKSSNPHSGIYEATTSRTLDVNGGNPSCHQGGVAVVEDSPARRHIVRRLTPTECARLQGFPDEWGVIDKKNNFTKEELSFWKEVRNTHAAINGRRMRDYTEKQMLAWYNKLHSDSAEYKMWGNGVALPPALYCMQGMAEALNEEEDRPTKCKR